MDCKRQAPSVFILFLLLVLVFLAGCSGGSSSTSVTTPTADVSRLAQIAADTKTIVAAQGGSVTYDEATIEFPAGALPADAVIKISKVSIDASEQDPSLTDMTAAYVISTTSSDKTIELASSATLKLRINPAGFDETTIRLVIWNGYEWEEVPFDYDSALKVVSSTAEAIMPYGTRIYMANPEARSSTNPRVREGGTQIISEFVAAKVVGETLDNAVVASARKVVLQTADTGGAGRAVYVKSPKGKFTVTYVQVKDPTEAAALKNKADNIAAYMDNAYEEIVTGMGLKEPGVNTNYGSGKTWKVKLRAMSGVHGTADPGKWEIEVNIGDEVGDGLSHTCHHEFTHLCQFQTLYKADNDVSDSLDWFNETMADAIGYYAQKKRGNLYCSADGNMVSFDVRLDADKHTLKNENDDYEYKHFAFISYLLAAYGEAKFKKFFETWYSFTPGSTQISMATIDTAAQKDGSLGKAITGRDGVYWDFYRDYFISGTVFNNLKFKNLSNRSSGAPFEITDDNKEKQGVTIVEVRSGVSYQKDFTIQRLAGQVAILRYKGSSPRMGLTVKVTSAPGQSSGRIQIVPFKRVGGILQPPGAVEEVIDGGTKTKDYTDVGTNIHDIYLLMVNASWKADDYKVTVSVAETE